MSTPAPFLRTDLAVGLIVGGGVTAAAVADWMQGQRPTSRLPDPVSSFWVFLIAVLVCVGLSDFVALGRIDPRWKYAAVAAAAVAAAVADPTYASLLFAVPLLEIGRRSPDPERWIATAMTLGFIAFLVLTEPTRRDVAEVEAMFVLAIAMAVVVSFAHALRRNDEARVAGARLARLDERSRLAQELHDSLGHNLLATSIQLRNASALIERDRDRAAHSIDLASQAVAEALADTRFAVDSIQSDGADFSLERSLPELVERVTRPPLVIRLAMSGDTKRLEQLTQMTLYRFVQEALSNVIRHADAATASVEFKIEAETATMVVADDGRGFDQSLTSNRAGLNNMRERLSRIGGRLEVSSAPNAEAGSGTTLRATIDLGS